MPSRKHDWRQEYRHMRRVAEDIHQKCYGQHAGTCGLIETMLGAMVELLEVTHKHHSDELQEVCVCHMTKSWQAFYSAYQLMLRSFISESLDLVRLGLETAWQNSYLHLNREKVKDWRQGTKFPAVDVRKALEQSESRRLAYDRMSELSHPRYRSFAAFQSFYENDSGELMGQVHLPTLYDQERLRYLLVRFAYYLNWPILEFVNAHQLSEDHPWVIEYGSVLEVWKKLIESEVERTQQ